MNKHISFGPLSQREQRLCYQEARGDFEQLGNQVANIANEYISAAVSQFREIIGTNEQTRANLSNEALWIDAFSRADVMNDEEVIRIEKGKTVSPVDVLRSLPLEERKKEFVRFIREVVPDDIRELFSNDKKYSRAMFQSELFKGTVPGEDFNQLFTRFRNRGGDIEEINGEIPRLQQMLLMLTGKEVTDKRAGDELAFDPDELLTIQGRYTQGVRNLAKRFYTEQELVALRSGRIDDAIALSELPYTDEEINILRNRHIDDIRSRGLNAFSAAEREKMEELDEDAIYNLRTGDYRDARNVAGMVLYKRYFKDPRYIVTVKPDGTHTDGSRSSDLYIDYRNTVKDKRIDPPLRDDERSKAALILNRIDDDKFSSRFKAAMRMGMVGDAVVDDLAELYQDEANERSQARLDNRSDINKIAQRDVFESAKERHRTLMDNWRSMGGKEKFFAVALASAATYMMLKSDNKFLKSVPFLIGGVYMYRRLVVGDKEPLNTMGKFTQDSLELTFKPVRKLLEKAGILKDTSDFMALNQMEQYLAGENLQEKKVATAFAVMSKVPVNLIAPALKVDANKGRASLNVAEDSPLHTEISEIARRHKLDHDEIFELLEEHNSDIAEGMTHVMYELGAEKFPDMATDLERRRGEVPPRTFLILNKDARKDYITLVNAGLEEASSSNKTFVEIITGLENQRVDPQEVTFDTADSIEKPYELDTKEKEKDLYEALRDKPMRIDSRKRLLAPDGVVDAEFTEAIDSLDAMGILDSGALVILQEKVRELRENDDLPLSEILLDIEKLKYALLISGLDDTSLPLSGDEVLAMLEDKGDIAEFFDSIYDYLVDATSVFSNFGEVNDLEDVQRLLNEDFFAGVKSINEAGFGRLKERIATYQRFMASLKGKELNPRLVAELMPILGADSEEFIDRIFKLPTDTERVEAMEQYLAQRMTNSIALAMLTEHRGGKSGIHSLEENPDKRMITRKEVENLMREFDALFEEVTGIDPDSGKGDSFTEVTQLKKYRDTLPGKLGAAKDEEKAAKNKLSEAREELADAADTDAKKAAKEKVAKTELEAQRATQKVKDLEKDTEAIDAFLEGKPIEGAWARVDLLDQDVNTEEVLELFSSYTIGPGNESYQENTKNLALLGKAWHLDKSDKSLNKKVEDQILEISGKVVEHFSETEATYLHIANWVGLADVRDLEENPHQKNLWLTVKVLLRAIGTIVAIDLLSKMNDIEKYGAELAEKRTHETEPPSPDTEESVSSSGPSVPTEESDTPTPDTDDEASDTPTPGTEESDTPAPDSDGEDSDTPTPDTDDEASDTPTPGTEESDTPAPDSDGEDSDTPTPDTDDEASDTPTPGTEESDTPAPDSDGEDSDTPTPDTDDEASDTPTPGTEESDTPAPDSDGEDSDTPTPDTDDEASDTPTPGTEESDTPAPDSDGEDSDTPTPGTEESGTTDMGTENSGPGNVETEDGGTPAPDSDGEDSDTPTPGTEESGTTDMGTENSGPGNVETEDGGTPAPDSDGEDSDTPTPGTEESEVDDMKTEVLVDTTNTGKELVDSDQKITCLLDGKTYQVGFEKNAIILEGNGVSKQVQVTAIDGDAMIRTAKPVLTINSARQSSSGVRVTLGLEDPAMNLLAGSIGFDVEQTKKLSNTELLDLLRNLVSSNRYEKSVNVKQTDGNTKQVTLLLSTR